jgi:putative glutamine amidotransferase
MSEELSAGDAPVIGISAASQLARWGAWETRAMVSPRRYADRVAEAGGIPVLLPPVPGVEQALRRVDGLLLSGGGDINPSRYGAPCAPETSLVPEERDAAEFALLHAALAMGLPVLGICRGIQVFNVALGGTLHQHLPDVVGHDGHSPVQGRLGAHSVRVAPGSRLAGMLDDASGADEPVSVPTHHHQGIDRLGRGLTATAWTTDGIVEAVELDPGESPFAIAVQWHPEAGADPGLFRALTAAALARVPEPAGR